MSSCGGNDRAAFPLDDLGDKLLFRHLVHGYLADSEALFSVVARVSASVRGSRIGSTFSWLSNLKRGSLVSDGYLRPYGFGTMAHYGNGPFVEPGIGFIGFAFNNGSGKQYGWVRVQMGGGRRGQRENNFKVLDYAYADPGEPIKTGQRSPDEPIIGMDALGLLAAGAVGLQALRRSRRTVNSGAP